MELKHDFTVPAPVEETWAAFNDPERVAPCFPGATLISVEGDQFTGSAKIKLGPIALQYNGVGTYVERDAAAYRAVIEAKGKDKRGNGTANATVTAQMSADGEGTVVHVTTDLAVTGKPAQFGRGVMQDVSDKLLEQFVACLKTTLGAPGTAPLSHADEAPVQLARPAHSAQPAQPPGARRTDAGQAAVAAPATTPQGNPAGGAEAPRTQAPPYRPATAAEVELNLLSTVGRVLLTRYAARALGPLALIVGYLLGRRSRR
ncbi:MAG: SRPBCC family protein [Dermatophilaceae bacterium]